MSEWKSRDHALTYLSWADQFPHRTEGEVVLLETVPREVHRILDVGAGDGRLLSLLRMERPHAQGVALDFSPDMLAAAGARFAGDPLIELVDHDLELPLPDLGNFDVVISSLAIHHLHHERKFSLYTEIFNILRPGGIFCNLEHVSAPSARLHEYFYQALGLPPDDEDPSDKLLDVGTQLGWLRQIGYVDVDCYWKWLELALLVGHKQGGDRERLD
jgi:SAM-dependent methyltransferase